MSEDKKTAFIDPNKIDPKLKIAKDEILEVLKKHDVAGTFCLTSQTHGEFFSHFPAWTIFEIKGGTQLHIKHKGEDVDGRVAASAHVVQSTRESLALMQGNFGMIYEELEKYVVIESKSHVAERFQPETMDG